MLAAVLLPPRTRLATAAWQQHSQNNLLATRTLFKGIQERPLKVTPMATQMPTQQDGHALAGRQLLSVAPMLDWTDVHYRQLARLLSKHTWLWTEMVVDKTIAHSPILDKWLWFPPEQRPIVCQLGGSDPALLAQAAKVVASYGYDEINLNCGCPSDRVAGAGCFGASLMLEAPLVAACMTAMHEACRAAGTPTPVTVKCRLGVDGVDSYEQLCGFVRAVAEGSPTRHFIIHSRKCLLKGLNPYQNRTVPPLKHEWVYALKRDLPHLTFSLNGGVQSAYEARAALDYCPPWFDDQQQQEQGQGQGPSQGQQQQQPGESSCGGGDADAQSGGSSAARSPSAGRKRALPAATAGGASDMDEGEQPQSAVASTSGRPGSSAGPQQPCDTTMDGVATAASASAPSSDMQGGQEDQQPQPQRPPAVYGPPRGGALEGVMIGRAAYNDPWGCLGDADRVVFGAARNAATSRRQVLKDYCRYAETMVGRWQVKDDGWRDPTVRALFKPLLNFFHGAPSCKKWKSVVDGLLKQDPPSVDWILEHSLHVFPDWVLDEPPAQSDDLPAYTVGPRPSPSDRAGSTADGRYIGPRAALSGSTEAVDGSSDRMTAKRAAAYRASRRAGADAGAGELDGDRAQCFDNLFGGDQCGAGAGAVCGGAPAGPEPAAAQALGS